MIRRSGAGAANAIQAGVSWPLLPGAPLLGLATHEISGPSDQIPLRSAKLGDRPPQPATGESRDSRPETQERGTGRGERRTLLGVAAGETALTAGGAYRQSAMPGGAPGWVKPISPAPGPTVSR